MGKRMAGKLRGHARLLEDAVATIGQEWSIEVISVLLAVAANLRRDADEEEQRGRDWNKERKAELAKLGIPEGEPRGVVPPKQDPWF